MNLSAIPTVPINGWTESFGDSFSIDLHEKCLPEGFIREAKIVALVDRQQALANAKVKEYEARMREMPDEKIDAEYRMEFWNKLE